MGLAPGYTAKRQIPDEPGQEMEFRYLGWMALKQARDQAQRDSRDGIRQMGGEVYKGILEARTADQVVDPINTHDMGTLLNLGLVAWSYPEPCTAENKAQLLPPTAEWAMRTIMELGNVDNAWGTAGKNTLEIEGRRVPDGEPRTVEAAVVRGQDHSSPWEERNGHEELNPIGTSLRSIGT